MRPRRHLLIGALLLIATAAFATGWAVNPAGTDALALGKLILRPATDEACLNLQLLEADPATPVPNDFWCVRPTHRCCFRTAQNLNYCWIATAQ